MGRQVLDRLQTKEVLRAVLHSILFHRLFGTVKPKTFEVVDVTMVSYGLVVCSFVGTWGRLRRREKEDRRARAHETTGY